MPGSSIKSKNEGGSDWTTVIVASGVTKRCVAATRCARPSAATASGFVDSRFSRIYDLSHRGALNSSS